MIDSSAMEYLRIVGSQSMLYYGKMQEGHPRTTNHPYLNNGQCVKSRLSYCGVLYPEVLLRFDLSRNELIVQSPDFQHIVLFPENVDYAQLHDRTVIYFRHNNLPGCPSTGYYILLHSGDCKVFEKQNVTLLQKDFSPTKIERHYVLSTTFYLYKDGVYHTVRTKRGLLKCLHPYGRELKQFISANNLRFRNNIEDFLILTVREYEKLSGL